MSVVADQSRPQPLAKSEERTAKSGGRSFADELRPLLQLRWLQLLVLSGLLVTVGVIAFNLKFSVLDLDIWWHLKVGDWIVQHRAVPHNWPFLLDGSRPPLGGLQLGIRSFDVARLRLVRAGWNRDLRDAADAWSRL